MSLHSDFSQFCALLLYFYIFRYGWISEPLANGEPHKVYDNMRYEDLIPLETDGMEPCGDLSRHRIVVGHNVSFDRAKIKEQYWLDRTGEYEAWSAAVATTPQFTPFDLLTRL